jgi:hypothetical protein
MGTEIEKPEFARCKLEKYRSAPISLLPLTHEERDYLALYSMTIAQVCSFAYPLCQLHCPGGEHETSYLN